jgi:hypothetical protein
MAISEKAFQQVQRDIEEIKQRLVRLERGADGERRTAARKRKPTTSRRSTRALSEKELAAEILRRAGLLAELSPEEKAMAAEWRALPEEEKQRVREELWNLKLEKPLSQIIIENR